MYSFAFFLAAACPAASTDNYDCTCPYGMHSMVACTYMAVSHTLEVCPPVQLQPVHQSAGLAAGQQARVHPATVATKKNGKKGHQIKIFGPLCRRGRLLGAMMRSPTYIVAHDRRGDQRSPKPAETVRILVNWHQEEADTPNTNLLFKLGN